MSTPTQSSSTGQGSPTLFGGDSLSPQDINSEQSLISAPASPAADNAIVDPAIAAMQASDVLLQDFITHTYARIRHINENEVIDGLYNLQMQLVDRLYALLDQSVPGQESITTVAGPGARRMLFCELCYAVIRVWTELNIAAVEGGPVSQEVKGQLDFIYEEVAGLRARYALADITGEGIELGIYALDADPEDHI